MPQALFKYRQIYGDRLQVFMTLFTVLFSASTLVPLTTLYTWRTLCYSGIGWCLCSWRCSVMPPVQDVPNRPRQRSDTLRVTDIGWRFCSWRCSQFCSLCTMCPADYVIKKTYSVLNWYVIMSVFVTVFSYVPYTRRVPLTTLYKNTYSVLDWYVVMSAFMTLFSYVPYTRRVPLTTS